MASMYMVYTVSTWPTWATQRHCLKNKQSQRGWTYAKLERLLRGLGVQLTSRQLVKCAQGYLEGWECSSLADNLWSMHKVTSRAGSIAHQQTVYGACTRLLRGLGVQLTSTQLAEHAEGLGKQTTQNKGVVSKVTPTASSLTQLLCAGLSLPESEVT